MGEKTHIQPISVGTPRFTAVKIQEYPGGSKAKVRNSSAIIREFRGDTCSKYKDRFHSKTAGVYSASTAFLYFLGQIKQENISKWWPRGFAVKFEGMENNNDKKNSYRKRLLAFFDVRTGAPWFPSDKSSGDRWHDKRQRRRRCFMNEKTHTRIKKALPPGLNNSRSACFFLLFTPPSLFLSFFFPVKINGREILIKYKCIKTSVAAEIDFDLRTKY